MDDDDINSLQVLYELLREKQQTIRQLSHLISQEKLNYDLIQNNIIAHQIQHDKSKQKQQNEILDKSINELQDQPFLSDISENLFSKEIYNNQEIEDEQIINHYPKNNFMHLCNSKIDWIKEIQQDNVQILKYVKNHPKYIIGISKDSEISPKYGRAVVQKRENFTDKYEQLLMIQLKNSEPIQNQLIQEEQNQQIEFIDDQIQRNKSFKQNLGMEDKLLIKNYVTITKEVKQEKIAKAFLRIPQGQQILSQIGLAMKLNLSDYFQR